VSSDQEGRGAVDFPRLFPRIFKPATDQAWTGEPTSGSGLSLTSRPIDQPGAVRSALAAVGQGPFSCIAPLIASPARCCLNPGHNSDCPPQLRKASRRPSRRSCGRQLRTEGTGCRTLGYDHIPRPTFRADTPHFMAAKASTKLRLLNPIVPMPG
jgi:hypothetical protein